VNASPNAVFALTPSGDCAVIARPIAAAAKVNGAVVAGVRVRVLAVNLWSFATIGNASPLVAAKQCQRRISLVST
jgi:hypothetical protein